MCGIVAVVGADAEQLAAAMSDRIRHRGPDARGLWTEADIALAHRRLSIVDLSDAAKKDGFAIRRTMIEASGLCSSCQAA